jgi:hypothetical protein
VLPFAAGRRLRGHSWEGTGGMKPVGRARECNGLIGSSVG